MDASGQHSRIDARPAVVTRKVLPTTRESEFLRLIRGGCSNQEGGVRLKIIHRTFESYRARLKRKFGARNVADLLKLATLDRWEESASALQGKPRRSSGMIRCKC